MVGEVEGEEVARQSRAAEAAEAEEEEASRGWLEVDTRRWSTVDGRWSRIESTRSVGNLGILFVDGNK
jgi:hypothetical protein